MPLFARSCLTLGLAAVVLVLVLTVNLSSLLLARAAEREREFAVSRALGANGSAVVRAMVIEGADPGSDRWGGRRAGRLVGCTHAGCARAAGSAASERNRSRLERRGCGDCGGPRARRHRRGTARSVGVACLAHVTACDERPRRRWLAPVAARNRRGPGRLDAGAAQRGRTRGAQLGAAPRRRSRFQAGRRADVQGRDGSAAVPDERRCLRFPGAGSHCADQLAWSQERERHGGIAAQRVGAAKQRLGVAGDGRHSGRARQYRGCAARLGARRHHHDPCRVRGVDGHAHPRRRDVRGRAPRQCPGSVDRPASGQALLSDRERRSGRRSPSKGSR